MQLDQVNQWRRHQIISTTVKFLYKDHLWDCPKVVLKTTFGQSQRWSQIRGTLCVENEEKNNFNFTNKLFNGKDVLILDGLNSGISLYFNAQKTEPVQLFSSLGMPALLVSGHRLTNMA